MKHSLKVIRSAGAAISDTCGHKLIETFQLLAGIRLSLSGRGVP